MYILNRYFHRKWNLLLGFFLLALIVTLVACGGESPSFIQTSGNSGGLPTEFRIGYQLVPNAELLTKEMGSVEAEFPEVDIQWMPFDSGRTVNAAMMAGKIDVGLVGSVPASVGVAQGLPYKVYFIHNIIGDNEALAVTAASKVTNLAEIKGKKIAVPFGSTSHFSLLSALDQEDIPPRDVNIVDMQPQAIVDAWEKGDIDGGFIWQPTLAKLLNNNGRVITTSKELMAKGIVTADLGVVSEEFAASYPDFLSQYVKLLNESVQFYRTNPTEAAAVISEAVGLSPEETSRVMSELVWVSTDEQASNQYLGVPEAPGGISQVLKDSAEFMVDQEALSSAPAINAYEVALYNQAVAE